MLRLVLPVLVAALAVVWASMFSSSDREPGRAEATRAAHNWVGTGHAQPARRDGHEWEVDVARPDGSLVEVTLGAGLELRGLDEELGPGGGPADDEVSGPLRLRAAAAALAELPGAAVLGVERERGGGLAVAVQGRGSARVEVDLDRRLNVLELEPEHPGDE